MIDEALIKSQLSVFTANLKIYEKNPNPLLLQGIGFLDCCHYIQMQN